ncbi:uncharacterized protein DUF3515 [Murinocardiopsis flavida]|uniref:Uncharacterized protein DUF3515 n=1 Tax=Murinocardiopsis flavida TaxID=645275 RepID=A0A2P8DED7_9ACTN|nr:DUF3515 domain-containing protein [Murinocardiopsis flavida]PSK95600.1 uncharacterized protein DUF3515 [Murinocardiopsis flavida]
MRHAALGAAVAGLALLAGCTGGDPDLPAPEPTGRAAELCPGLMGALPDSLLGEQRKDVSPDSEYVVGWGSPAIMLRCGVDRPKELRPESELVVINDIAWLGVPTERPVTFTAVGRHAYVELTVPESYDLDPAESLLDVSDLVEEHLPALPAGEL